MKATMPAADDRSVELDEHLEALASGANWFYSIADLSLINAVIQFTGGEMRFIVMLGITQVFDASAAVAGGLVLYALVGLLFLMVGDWLSIAFHVFALVGLAAGFGALHELRALESPRPTGA